MSAKRLCDDIIEMMKNSDLSNHERVLCLALIEIYKEIVFIKRLAWLLITVVVSNTGILYLLR